MLVNLTNHPSTKWSKQQYEQAKDQYQLIIDLPFPSINPYWTEDQVVELAKEYRTKVLKLLPKISSEDAVLLAGEYIFTFTLCQLLQFQNIQCIAACTQREVVENGEEKKSIFRFIQFRKYPNGKDLQLIS